jgi:hypothetical protein
MALEYEIRGDKLLWIKNPVTGVISYVVDLRGKSFAFTMTRRFGMRSRPAHSVPATRRRPPRKFFA